jgi:hypothetical protein
MSLKEGKGRWKGQGGARWQRVCLNMYGITENIFPFQFRHNRWHFHTLTYTTLYFVNQRSYKTLAMQAHAFTRTRCFYSLNVIFSHLIVYKEGLGYLSYVLSLRGLPLPPTCVFVTVIQAQEFCLRLNVEESDRGLYKVSVISALRDVTSLSCVLS